MPHAKKMIEEKGKDGLVAIMIECGGKTPAADVPAFLAQRFPGAGFWSTLEQPFRGADQGNTNPFAFLIGADGTMLWQGNPNGAVKKVEELIDAELKKIKTGWGASPEIKKARMQMHFKGALGEAGVTLTGAEANLKETAKEDHAAAKAELETIYAALKKGVENATLENRYADADRQAKALAKAVKGQSDWETEVKAIVESMSAPDVAKEVKLSLAIEKAYHSNGDKAPTADVAKKLRDIAKKNADAKSSAYAERLAKYAEFQVAR